MTEVLYVKTLKKEKFKKAVYSLSALALCAAALFGFWKSNKNNPDMLNTTEPSISETFYIPETEEIKANTPVTNIPDDRASTEATETSTLRGNYFAMPLENGVIKNYSNGEIVKNITTGDWRTHNGLDLKGTVGDPVKSINNGKVIDVYDDALWGTIVSVDHYDGLIAEYRGLGKGSTVKKGDTVKINDKIGNLGEIPIEKNDGVHLHLEIFRDGKSISPTEYIGKTVE